MHDHRQLQRHFVEGESATDAGAEPGPKEDL